MMDKREEQCTTQTLYGTSTSTVPTTVASSVRVPASQTPVVQTKMTSTCVSTPGGGNFLATGGTSSTASVSSTTTLADSSSLRESSTMWPSSIATSQRGPVSSITTTTSTSTESQPTSRQSTDGASSDSTVRHVGTPQRQSSSSSTTPGTTTETGVPTSMSTPYNHHARFVRVHRDFRKLGQDTDDSQCSWSTYITTITSSAPAQETWSTTTITTSSESIVTFSTGNTVVGCQTSSSSTWSATSSITPSTSPKYGSSSYASTATQPWLASSFSPAPISTHHTQIEAVQTTQTSLEDWTSSSEDEWTDTSSPSPASTSTSSVVTTSSASKSLTSPISSPKTLSSTPTTIQHEAASNPSSSSSSSSSSSASPGITVNADNSKDKSNKGVSAGAAIGGIVGMLALIAFVLFCIRWYKRRQRQERTEHLRSSWFYGGDVAIPSPSPSTEESDTASQHSRPPVTSRFSAPSVRHSLSQGVSRLSRVAPFLAHPIEHIRKTSTGRFPVPNMGIGSLGMPFGLKKTEGSYEEKMAEDRYTTTAGMARRISPPRPILMSGPTTTQPTTFSLLPDPPVHLGALDTPPILDFPLPAVPPLPLSTAQATHHPYAQAQPTTIDQTSAETRDMEVLSTARPWPAPTSQGRIVSAAERASGSWTGLDETLSYVPVDRTQVLLAVQNPDIHVTAPSATSSLYSVATVSERGVGGDAARVSRVGAYRPAAQRPVSDRSEKITRGGGAGETLLYPVPSMPVAHRPSTSTSTARHDDNTTGVHGGAPQVDLSLPQLPLFLPPFGMDSSSLLPRGPGGPGGDRQTQATSSVFEYDRSGRESLAASSFKTTREERMTRDWYDRDTWVGEGAGGQDGSAKQERKKSVRWDDGPRVL